MHGVRCPIPVPGTCWGRRAPGTCWGRRAMSFASILLPFGSRIPVPGTCWAELDLLAMLGVRCPIPVPGTCWAEPGFASNSGRQVPDSGARHLLGRRFRCQAPAGPS
jgi:hypothetical protein